ncbi:MAG: peptidoglycan-binding domain-containing protein, partial [Patescibacteria group bacterium]
MKKYILGAVLSFGILVSPVFAPQVAAAGLTSTQVQAILSLLSSFGADQSVINSVQTSLAGGPPATGGGSTFCHDFYNNLTIGSTDKGSGDVSALNRALVLSGIEQPINYTFDEGNAGAVVLFQAKYGIRQTGYVGSLTRAKLNALYGCRDDQQSTQTTAPA